MAWLRSSVLWFDPRRRTIALVLAGWVVLMVVAAGRSADDGEWVAIPDLSWLLAAALLLSALVGLITLIVVRPSMKQALGERRRMSIRTLLITIAVVAAVALLLDGQEVLEEEPVESATPDLELGTLDAAEDTVTGRTVSGGDMAVFILLAGLAAAVIVWSRSASSPEQIASPAPESFLEPEIVEAVNDATELLLHGADPREAVMAAYAALEQALEGHGRPRRLAETPTEHLRRVLQSFPSLAEPTLRLGGLYELARFSEASIAVADQRDAAKALDRARAELSSLRSSVR